MGERSPSQLRQICLLRLSALGDVCLVIPLVRTLQHAFPQASLTWVISRPMHALVEGLPGVEFVLVDKARPLSGWWDLYRRLRGREFDVLLAIQASWRANLLYPAIPARRKIGFDRNRARDCHAWFVREQIPPGRDHLLDGFLSFARQLGVNKPILEWGLPLADTDRAFAQKILGGWTGRWLAVNPGASKSNRNWLPERYAAVIDEVWERKGIRTVLTGGTSAHESEVRDAVLHHCRCRDQVLDLFGRTTPKQLAAVLERVTLVLSPDTGPAHIATAMGTPVVGLYAVAPPELSGPYRSQHLVINRFPQAVRQVLGKDPATVPWGTRVHSPEAMALITVPDVLASIERALVS